MKATLDGYREGFEYHFSRLDPQAAHVDPPAVAVYETLLARGPAGLPVPRLAESWKVSDSGLAWDVRLRAGQRFHSGALCNAPAVLRTLDALRWDMHLLPSGRQLWYWDPVDRVEAIDDTTLRFHLHHPHPRLYTLLWGTHTAIHNEDARLEDPGAFGTLHADGTGPYRLETWSDSRVELVRADGNEGAVSRAAWLALPAAEDRLSALLSGEVDCVHALDSKALRILEGDSRFKVERHPQSSSMYLTVDWTRTEYGFDQAEIRRAFSLAIDRGRLVREGLGGLGTPTWGPLPPTLQFYDSGVETGRRRDLEESRALLRAHGWTPGPRGVCERDGVELSFECLTQDDDTFKSVAQGVADDLRLIGVELQIRYSRPFAPFYSEVSLHPAASISKWLWPDTVEALKGFCSTSTIPFPNWQQSSVPALDSAFEVFTRAQTELEIQAAADTIQTIFADVLPYIPLLTPDDVWAWRSHLRGFAPRRGDLYPLYDDLQWAQSGQD
jgi:peptide/nickel transport system substrate-binding protein